MDRFRAGCYPASAMRFRAATLAALVVFAGGCTALHRVPVRPEITTETRWLERPGGMSITGYQTRDGAFHRYRGWVSLSGDSLVFRPNRTTEWFHDRTDSLRLARDQVPSLLYRSVDTGKSSIILLGVLTAGILAFVVLVAIALSDWE